MSLEQSKGIGWDGMRVLAAISLYSPPDPQLWCFLDLTGLRGNWKLPAVPELGHSLVG